MLWTDATKRDEVIQEHDDHKVESFKRSPLLIRQLAYQRAYQHWLKKSYSHSALFSIATLLEDHDDMGAFFA